MEYAHSEHIFLTPSCVDSSYLVLLEYVEQAAANEAVVETEDAESAHSELIFSTPSCIGYVFLWLLEDDFK